MAKGPTPRKQGKKRAIRDDKRFDALDMLFPERRIKFNGRDDKIFTVVVTMPSWRKAPNILELISKMKGLIETDDFAAIAEMISREIIDTIDKCLRIEDVDVDVSLRDLPPDVIFDVIEAFISMHDLKKWQALAEKIAATFGFQGSFQEILTRIKSGIPSAASPPDSATTATPGAK